MAEIIISEAIDAGINDYLTYRFQPESPEFNSFNVVVIRLLCIIYGEEGIITPYLSRTANEFNTCLTKFGYELDKVIDLENQIEKSYDLLKNEKINPYFNNIQKILIDMFMLDKQRDVARTNAFYDLLYTKDVKNPLQLSEYYLNANNSSEIEDYFKQAIMQHQKVFSTQPKVILNPEVYPMVGITMDAVNSMTPDYLEFINHQIYLHFGIKDNMINKEYLLEQAIEKEKRKRGNSGRGYANILLILGILTTIALGLAILNMIMKI